MNYLNLRIETLSSEAFLGTEPTNRATWLCLLRYCAQHETGGVISGAADWGNRKWMQLCGVTEEEVSAECDLWRWDGEDLCVCFYPIEQEAELQAKREAGKKYGKSSAKGEQKAEQGRKGNGNGNGNGKSPQTPQGDDKEPTKSEKHDAAVGNVLIPSGLDTDEFREVFFDFCAERRERKQYVTDRALKGLLNKLKPHGVNIAIEALQESIANSYQGVFPEKHKQQDKPKTQADHNAGGTGKPVL